MGIVYLDGILRRLDFGGYFVILTSEIWSELGHLDFIILGIRGLG